MAEHNREQSHDLDVTNTNNAEPFLTPTNQTNANTGESISPHHRESSPKRSGRSSTKSKIDDEDKIEGDDPALKDIIWRVTSVTLQNGICNILEVLETVILVYFLGRETDLIQSSVGLATVMKNCFAYAVTYSLSLGLEAIASQAYGYESYELVGVYLQKSIVLGWLLLIPICILFGFMQSILVVIGIDAATAEIAWNFMMLSIPHTFFVALADQVKAFLHAQNIFDLPTYASVISMALHFGMCYFFIIHLGWSYYGAALSINLCEGFRVILMILFSINKPTVRQTWVPWSRKSLEGWSTFLKVSFGMGAFVYLEWVCFELFTIQAGLLDNPAQLAAQVILTNLYVCFYQLGEGVHISMNTYVAQCVGEGNKNKAITLCKAGTIVLYGQYIVLIGFLYVSKGFWVDGFTTTPEVKEIINEVFWPFCLVMIFDWAQVMMMGILKAINQHIWGSVSCVVAFLILGQPLVYYFVFEKGWGIRGIWFPYFAPCIIALIAYGIIIYRTKWEDQVAEVQDRLDDDSYFNDAKETEEEGGFSQRKSLALNS